MRHTAPRRGVVAADADGRAAAVPSARALSARPRDARLVRAALAAGRAVLAAALAVLAAVPAGAATRLVLPRPAEVGSFPAATYDEDGRRIGRADLAFEELAGGRMRARVETSVDRGGRMLATAVLEPVDGGLRLLEESSQSYAADGTPFPFLHVDHVTGVATCTPPPGSGERFRRIDLPDDERVVNVPLNLLFQPLVLGRAEQLDFQIFICGRGGRVIDFIARARPIDGEDGSRVVEVRYRPDFGAFSFLTEPAVPNLAFWFDGAGEGRYLAHRIPLHPGGPEVLVAREGVAPGTLLDK